MADTYDQIEININCDFDLLPRRWQVDKLDTARACFEEMYRTGVYRESSVNEMVQAKAVHEEWMRRNQSAITWAPELFVPFEELEQTNPPEQFKKVRVVRACRLVRSMYEDIIEEELDLEFFAEEAAREEGEGESEGEVEVEGELFEGAFEGEFGDEVEAVGLRGGGGGRVAWGEEGADVAPEKEYLDSFIKYEGVVGSVVKRRAAAVQAETSLEQDEKDGEAAVTGTGGEGDEDDDLPPLPPSMPSLMKGERSNV